MTNKIIELQNIYKKYGTGESATLALNDVSLDIFDGEFLVILGNSGSGKSTLLNIIGGIDKEDNGLVSCFGRTISILSENERTRYRKNNVGFVFQSFNLINELTALENVMVVSNDQDKAKKALIAVGLKDKINSYPNKLSGGQRQRVSIARAIVNNPRILLCDEPTGALDYETGKAVLSLIEKINNERGTTVIFVTHTKEIAKMAHRVVKLKNGKIEFVVVNTNRLSSENIEW